MKCRNCDNKATIEIIITSNDKEEHVALCSECYNQLQWHGPNKEEPQKVDLLFTDVLKDLLSGVMQSTKNDESDDHEISCPGCGYTLKKINDVGRFGCDQCYQTFRGAIRSVLKTTQGNTQHIGVHPKSYTEIIELRDAIASMKKELEEMVFEEDYENAADVRDRLKEMSEQLSALRGGHHG